MTRTAQPVLDETSDHLGASVLRNLSRWYWNQFSTSAIRAGILGLLTLGLWPLVRLRRQFRGYVTFERQQLWYLAEWLRTRLGGAEAEQFAGAVKRLRYRRTLQWMQTWCLIAIVVVMVNYSQGGHWVDQVLDRTFRFVRQPASAQYPLFSSFVTWNAGLAIAYALHWVQIRRHGRRIATMLSRFDALTRREGIDAAPLPMTRPDPDFKWGGVAMILTALGGAWAIPMAVAGAAQRRYINVTATATRAKLLVAVRAIQAQRRPAINVINYTIHGRRCENGLCQATLPQGARFCPRCGARVALSNVA